ncbi:MAG TPA: zinc-binding alcohol dehydrogenase [Micromonosporaceae bacterium]|nr:zinc-binding alcohol dehydrogenase [Micromonosporaceae bacterium]
MEVVVQFSGPRQVDVVSAPPEPLPPGHVRVRTRYSGISAGTELTAYRGTNPYLTRVWDPSTRLFTEGAGSVDYPVVGWGYSEVGDVVEVASDVADPVVGDLVWGIWGHRGQAVLSAERLAGHQVPDGVAPLAASFARVGAVALNAVLAADVHLGETVAVFGQGVIGLLATRLATLNGGAVVAVDTIEARRKAADWQGATATLPAASAAEEIRRRTGGDGADVAIEISGAYPALHEAIRSVAVGGRVVAAGFYQGDGLGLRLGEEFHHNRVELVCSQIGGVPPRLTPRWSQDRLQRVFLNQLAAGAIDVGPLVSHLIPVARAPEAYELLDAHPADALQVVLDFGTESS